MSDTDYRALGARVMELRSRLARFATLYGADTATCAEAAEVIEAMRALIVERIEADEMAQRDAEDDDVDDAGFQVTLGKLRVAEAYQRDFTAGYRGDA